MLECLINGTVSCAHANEQFRAIRKQVPPNSWNQGFKNPDYKGEEGRNACGLYNLLGELILMTGFENQDRGGFEFARKIVNKPLADYLYSGYWGELVKRRGPVEGLGIAHCNACGRTMPDASVSGFLRQLAAFCNQCGAMVMYPVCDEPTTRIYKIFETWDPARRKRMSEEWRIQIPTCPCGGDLFTEPTNGECIECHTDHVEIKSISPYEYFQSHKHGDLKPNGRVVLYDIVAPRH